MDELVKILPIQLSTTLLEIKKQLSDIKHEIISKKSIDEIVFETQKLKQVSIIYNIKDTEYFFSINFLKKRDLISWKFLPQNRTSTILYQSSHGDSNDSVVYNRLINDLNKWKGFVLEAYKIENPIDFFDIDNFIKFYSDEILAEYEPTPDELKYPLSTDKQLRAIELLNKQAEFIDQELREIEDNTSEQYNDLSHAKILTERIKENISRTTEAEVRRNWSISLAYIRKWCGEKFLQFLMLDKSTNYDLLRTLGSFMGGAIGIPKLES
jgi:hypothetical protein